MYPFIIIIIIIIIIIYNHCKYFKLKIKNFLFFLVIKNRNKSSQPGF